MNLIALIAFLLNAGDYKLLCVSTAKGGGDPCVIWYSNTTLYRYETTTGEFITRDLTHSTVSVPKLQQLYLTAMKARNNYQHN